jgi:hypothetical protein
MWNSARRRRLIVASWLIVLAIAAASGAQGDQPKQWVKNSQIDLSVYGPWKDGSRRVRAWAKVVGERVVAEGLAWGVRDKGIGQRILLDYAHVYVDGPELPEGKLVRVTGTLRVRDVKAVPRTRQGYGEDFSYYYIKAEKVEEVEVVRAPMLVEPEAKK